MAQQNADLAENIWKLCGAAKIEEYKGVWHETANDLWQRLESIVSKPTAAMRAASRLDFVGCRQALFKDAPALYRLMVDIRSLVEVSEIGGPVEPAKTRSAAKTVKIGLEIDYERISMHEAALRATPANLTPTY